MFCDRAPLHAIRLLMCRKHAPLRAGGLLMCCDRAPLHPGRLLMCCDRAPLYPRRHTVRAIVLLQDFSGARGTTSPSI